MSYKPSESERNYDEDQLESQQQVNEIVSDNNYLMDGDGQEDTENMGYTLEFLSDYEENLPEYFEESKVKRENANQCRLCSKSLFTK